MSYTTRERVVTKLPDQFLVEALDDDGDGNEDAGLFTALLATVDEEIDGLLEGRYQVPFASPPAVVAAAALTLVLELLYFRRGFDPEKNPWTKPAAEMRARLRRIGTGEAPLQTGHEKPSPSIIAVTEPARTHSQSNRLLA